MPQYETIEQIDAKLIEIEALLERGDPLTERSLKEELCKLIAGLKDAIEVIPVIPPPYPILLNILFKLAEKLCEDNS